MDNYERLKNTINTFNQHWRDGMLNKLHTKLPQLAHGDKLHSISDVENKEDGVYIDFSTDFIPVGKNLHLLMK